jgi:hypothetical protein
MLNRFNQQWTQLLPWMALASSMLFFGCKSISNSTAIPSFYRYDRDGLVFHTDHAINSGLINEMIDFKKSLAQFFETESPPEIEIFLFSDREHLSDYVQQWRPHYPNRRALYVRKGNTHRIYAYQDKEIEKDIRHEMTHVFVQQSSSEVPLWLDEGMAEYFEACHVEGQINSVHLEHLKAVAANESWKPDFERLQKSEDPYQFTQLNYAEAWLWVHWMMSKQDHQTTFARLTDPYIGNVQYANTKQKKRLLLAGNETELQNYLYELLDKSLR